MPIKIDILPVPKKIVYLTGIFAINHKTKIVLDSKISNLILVKEIVETVKKATYLHLEYMRSLKPTYENQIIIELNSGLNEQEYTLDVSQNSIVIKGRDAKACYYGVQTLKQIITASKLQPPCMNIIDSPDIEDRIWYIDTGRNKVPTLNTMKKMVDKCAKYKINQLQFYIEHAFKFDNCSEVWCGIDAMTKEDIMEIDNYCAERYIELVPSIPTFGHLYDVLRTDSFGDLCELDNVNDGTAYWGEKARHHTLDPLNPGSLELVKMMIDETIPLFSSNKFNICCDETFDLGKEKNSGKDIAKLYVDFLCKIINYTRNYGKIVMFWADVIANYPDLTSQIPDDVIIINWNYNVKSIAQTAEQTKDAKFAQYGTACCFGHQRVFPALDLGYKNIYMWAEIGVNKAYKGLIFSSWGDWGNFVPFELTLQTAVYSSSLMWNFISEFENEREFNKLLSNVEYGKNSNNIAQKIYDISLSSTYDWMCMMFWLDSYLNKYSEDTKAYYGCSGEWAMSYFNVPEDKIIRMYNEINVLLSELMQTDILNDDFHDLENIYTAANGLALTICLTQAIKQHCLKQKCEKPIISFDKLAIELEIWIENTQRCWRKDFKQSEFIYNIKAVREFATFLRRLK